MIDCELLHLQTDKSQSLFPQSRSVRNAVASFIWTTKRDDVDFKFLRKVRLRKMFSLLKETGGMGDPFFSQGETFFIKMPTAAYK